MASENEITGEPEFKETQKTGPGLMLVLAAGLLVFSGAILHEVTRAKPDYSSVAALTALLCIYLIPITVLLFYARLITHIDKKGIYYGWTVPTKDLNFIPRENIKSCELITHKFVGYGYKLTKRYGIVYNTQGRQGLQILTHGGEKILLGTLKPAEMQQALTELGLLTG